ncbi:hypothetical protein BDV12DRAFT_189332 [Aspergillus spectabilis]
MKSTFALSLFAMKAATAVAADCNVDGNLFQLRAFQTLESGTRRTGQVKVTQIGDLGTDTLAHFSASSTGGPETATAVFYLNKDNERLIVLDSFSFLKASNAYTDALEGGELKFTFYNGTSRPEPYNWPVFDISADGFLTVDGKSDVFSHCPTDPESALLTGSIAVGTPGKDGCEALDGLKIYPVTSELAVE